MEDKTFYAFTPYVEKMTERELIQYGYSQSEIDSFTNSRATVAMKRVGNSIWYGVSICNLDEDNFNKSIGKSLAETRMNEGYGHFPISTAMQSRYEGKGVEMMLCYLNSVTNSVFRNMRKTQRKITERAWLKPKLVAHRGTNTAFMAP